MLQFFATEFRPLLDGPLIDKSSGVGNLWPLVAGILAIVGVSNFGRGHCGCGRGHGGQAVRNP